MKQEATNTFGDGMIMDLNPLTTPNNVLTSALNATMITYNGNEFVLQNDMGNGRVETAYLPSGYVPVGIKEYGGIIYVASYNPLTNKGQIGSFPSPERNISSSEINKAKDPIIDSSKFKLNQGQYIYKFKLFGDTGNTIIRSGDKFSIIITSDITLETLKTFVSNCLNTTEGKITSPKNKLLSITVAVFDSNNNLRDITSQLKRIDQNNKVIEFDATTLPEVKYNTGYYMQCIPESTITDDLVDNFRERYAANTYNNKISGELYIITKLNTISALDVSVSGLKNLDKDSEEVDGITVPKDSSLVIFDTTYKYNCPDGYYKDNPADMSDSMRSKYLSYYGIESDFKGSKGDFSSFIKGIEFDLNTTSTRSSNKFYLPFIINEESSIPVYNESSSLYISEQSAGYVVNDTSSIINFTITPYMTFGALAGLAVNGSINLDLLGSGIIEINTWKYFCEQDNVTITWGLEAYPRTGDEIQEVEFMFYDVLNPSPEKVILEYPLARKRSYNGVFTETLAFGSTLAYGNLYLVRVVITTVKGNVLNKYRWLLTTPLYNKLYFGVQDFGQDLDTISSYNNVDLSVSTSYGIQNTSETKTAPYSALFNESGGEQKIEVHQYTKYSSIIELKDSTTINDIDNYPFTLNLESINTTYTLKDATVSIPNIVYVGSMANINSLDAYIHANSKLSPTVNIDWDSFSSPEFTAVMDNSTGRTDVNLKLVSGLISGTVLDTYTFENPYQSFIDNGDKFNRIFGYDFLDENNDKSPIARVGVAFNVRKKAKTVWRHMPKFTKTSRYNMECPIGDKDRNVGDNSDKGWQYLNNKTRSKVVEVIDGYYGRRPLCIVVGNAGMISGDAHVKKDSNNGYDNLAPGVIDMTRVEMLWWYNGASYDYVQSAMYWNDVAPSRDYTSVVYDLFKYVLLQFGESVTKPLFGPELITSTYNNKYSATLQTTTLILKNVKEDSQDSVFSTKSGFFNEATIKENLQTIADSINDTIDADTLFEFVDFKLQPFSVEETSERTYLVQDMVDTYNRLQSIENKSALPIVAITDEGVIFSDTLLNNQVYYYGKNGNDLVVYNPRIAGQPGYDLLQNLKIGKHEGRITLLSNPMGLMTRDFYTERDGSRLCYVGIPVISFGGAINSISANNLQWINVT